MKAKNTLLLGVILWAVAMGSLQAHPKTSNQMSGPELVKASVRTINPKEGGALFDDVCFKVIFEIHDNELDADFPRHCLVQAFVTNFSKFMVPGTTVVVRSEGGLKLVKLAKKDPATGQWIGESVGPIPSKDIVGRVYELFRTIGADHIPASNWGSEDYGPGAMRVLMECWGTSMLPKFSTHSLLAVTIRVPFSKVREGEIVAYWNPLVRSFTAHQLVVWWGMDKSFTAKGFNNSRVDKLRVNSWNFMALIHGQYEDLTATRMVASK